MKALLGFVVVLVVLLVVTPAALDRWVDTQVVEVGAARAALAMEKAKQAAIETEALRRQADLDARVAAVSAAHRIELNLAWQSIEFVFVLAMAGAVVAGVYGLVAAGVQAARLRARLIYPQAGMASGVYPLVSTPQGVIEPPAPRLATRREPPALTAAPACPVMIEPPGPPDLVDLRTWQGDGLPLGVSAAGPVSVALDGSWSLGLVAGLPGMGNFVGEFLVLLGAWRASVPLTVLAALGLVVSTVYAVWMVQKTFFGLNASNWRIPDLGVRETTSLCALMAVILWIGLYPGPFLNTARDSLANLREAAHAVLEAQSAPAAGGDHDRP